MSSTSAISDQYNSFLRHLTADPELAELWIRAFDGDPDSLDEAERSRAIMLMGYVLRILENAYLHYRAGRMDNASWEGYEKLIYRGAYSPLFPIYWSIRKEMHNTEFAKLMEHARENPDRRRMFG
jgi:hypothetical protein